MSVSFFVNHSMGGIQLAQLKKIQVNLPEGVLSEMDSLIEKNHSDRNQIIAEALKRYLRERKKIGIKAELRRGYKEMAEINLCLAEEYTESDYLQLREYEQRLKEMD